MKSHRLLALLLAGCCFLHGEPARAQATPAYLFPKQFSSDEVVTTAQGTTINMKVYSDNGKVRSEINASGMQLVYIVRPDQQKMYTVMEAQHMVVARPIDPAAVQQMMPPGSGGDAKVTLVGPDTVDGTAAMKYQITSDNGKTVLLWVGAVSQFPLKLASPDGTFTAVWKNFQAGPQDPSLFEPPAGYQVVTVPAGMPSGMPSPGGAPPPGGGQ